MKPRPSLIPRLAVALAVTAVLRASEGTPSESPAAASPPPAPHGPPLYSAADHFPWFNGQPLPTDDELKLLRTARDTAEKDMAVVIATRTYAERFGVADDLVRTLIFQNSTVNQPEYQDFARNFKTQQVLHENTWNIGLPNSRDFLLPDLNAGAFGSFLSVHKSSGTPGPRPPLEQILAINRQRPPQETQRIRASYEMEDIHHAALNDKDAQAALQKTRDAFQSLDDAVRQTMKRDPAIDALIQKYPYLLYGRRDLGFEVAAIYFTT